MIFRRVDLWIPKISHRRPQAKSKPKIHPELNFGRKVSKLQPDFGMERCIYRLYIALGLGKWVRSDHGNLTAVHSNRVDFFGGVNQRENGCENDMENDRFPGWAGIST